MLLCICALLNDGRYRVRSGLCLAEQQRIVPPQLGESNGKREFRRLLALKLVILSSTPTSLSGLVEDSHIWSWRTRKRYTGRRNDCHGGLLFPPERGEDGPHFELRKEKSSLTISLPRHWARFLTAATGARCEYLRLRNDQQPVKNLRETPAAAAQSFCLTQLRPFEHLTGGRQ